MDPKKLRLGQTYAAKVAGRVRPAYLWRIEVDINSIGITRHRYRVTNLDDERDHTLRSARSFLRELPSPRPSG